MNGLPRGWTNASIEQLAGAQGLTTDGDWIETKDQDPNGDVRLIQLADIGDGEFRDRSARFVTSKTVDRLNCTLLEKGDLLIARMPDPLGRACVFPGVGQPAITAVDVLVWRPQAGGPLSRWLMHFVNSEEVRNKIAEQAGGTTRQRVAGGRVKQLVVPVPPLPEQRCIVAKIDRLFAKSKRARDHLDHIPRLVEKYKQAILAAAFRGELIGLSPLATVLPDPKCWELPAGWQWAPFSAVAEIASILVRPETVAELPHIAPDNVESGTGRLLPYRTIKEDGVISPKHRFGPGQVIYSKIRPYLRKAILADFDGACSADMYPLTLKEGVFGLFLLYWLISEQFAAFTVEHEGRTVLPKINQAGLNSTPFPLAPFNAQQETARRIESAFAWIDRLASQAPAPARSSAISTRPSSPRRSAANWCRRTRPTSRPASSSTASAPPAASTPPRVDAAARARSPGLLRRAPFIRAAEPVKHGGES
jgi:type I restriction enzyme, S subunit